MSNKRPQLLSQEERKGANPSELKEYDAGILKIRKSTHHKDTKDYYQGYINQVQEWSKLTDDNTAKTNIERNKLKGRQQVSPKVDAFVEDTKFHSDDTRKFVQEHKVVDDNTLSDHIIDVPRQILGGFRAAGQATIDLGLSAMDASGLDVKKGDIELPKKIGSFDISSEPKNIVSGLTKSISQFLLPFGAVSKGVRAVGAAGKAANAVSGAVATFIGFDEHEKRLSSIVEEHPMLSNPITRYLANKDDDSVFQGRLKNAAEGLGVGEIAGKVSTALSKGVKYIKTGREAKNVVQESTKTVGDIVENFKSQQVTRAIEQQQLQARQISNVTTENLTEDSLKQKIQKSGIQEDITRATELADEHLSVLKDTHQHFLNRIEIGDNTVADEMLNGPIKNYIHTAFETKKGLSEVARTLGQSGHSEGIITANKISDLISNADVKTKDQFVASIFDLAQNGGDVRGFTESVANMDKSKATEQAIRSVYSAGLLSGTRTHLHDYIGGAVFSASQVPERFLAAISGSIRTSIFHGRNKDKAVYKETTSLLHGAYSTFSDIIETTFNTLAGRSERMQKNNGSYITKAFSDLKDTFKESRMDFKKQYNHEFSQPLNPMNFGKSDDTLTGKALNLAGTYCDTVYGALTVLDPIRTKIAYRGDLMARAHRRANFEGLEGKAYSDRVKEFLSIEAQKGGIDNIKLDNHTANVYKAMSDKSKEYSKSLIFMQDAKESSITKKSMEFIEKLPYSWLLVPFKKTATNIASEILDRNLMSTVGLETLRGIKNKIPVIKNIPLIETNFTRALKNGGADFDIAMGKLGFSSLMQGSVAMSAMRGHVETSKRDGSYGYLNTDITGKGPGYSSREYKPLKNAGWQEQSIKVGDHYYDYSRLDPLASNLFMPARIHELAHRYGLADLADGDDDFVNDAKNVLKASTIALTETIMDKTYFMRALSTISSLNKASENPKPIQEAFQNTLMAFVPNIVREVGAGIVNKNQQISEGLFDKLVVKFGGYTVNKTDPFGDPVQKKQLYGMEDVKDGSTLNTLYRDGVHLQEPTPMLKIARESRNIVDSNGKILGILKNNIRLDHKQYARLKDIMKDAGYKQEVENFMSTDLYKSLPAYSVGKRSGTKQSEIDKIRNRYVAGAKKILINEDKSLQKKKISLEHDIIKMSNNTLTEPFDE